MIKNAITGLSTMLVANSSTHVFAFDELLFSFSAAIVAYTTKLATPDIVVYNANIEMLTKKPAK